MVHLCRSEDNHGNQFSPSITGFQKLNSGYQTFTHGAILYMCTFQCLLFS